MTSIGQPPLFTGDQRSLSIHNFFTKLERWFTVNNISKIRWSSILDTVIEDPAKATYDAAVALGAAPGIVNVPIPAIAAPGADEGIVRAADRAIYVAYENLYTNKKDWLLLNHHGQVEQDRIKEEIPTMTQGLNELPSHFYGRIFKAVKNAGYPVATREIITRSHFELNLHREIKYHLNMMPRLANNEMTAQADRIWRNLTGNQAPLIPQYETERNLELELEQPQLTIQQRPRFQQ